MEAGIDMMPQFTTPAGVAIDFQDEEIISPQTLAFRGRVLSMRVPQNLRRRRFYALLQANLTGGVVTTKRILQARVELRNAGRPVGWFGLTEAFLPAAYTAENAQSVPSNVAGLVGASPGGNSLLLNLSKFDSFSPNIGYQVSLQPLELEIECDEIQLTMTKATGEAALVGYRVYIACLSMA